MKVVGSHQFNRPEIMKTRTFFASTTCREPIAPRFAIACVTRLLSLLLLSLLPGVAQAQLYYMYYTTNNGTITITGYTGPGGAVTVPPTVHGLPVTRLQGYSFAAAST